MESALKEKAATGSEIDLPRLLLSQKNIEKELEAIKAEADRIDQAIRARVADAVMKARNDLQKYEGTVHAVVDGIEVVSNVPKRVEWDTDKLDALSGEMVAMGVEPSDFIEFKLSIPEKKYSSAPDALRSLLDTARTVKHGKETLKFTL